MGFAFYFLDGERFTSSSKERVRGKNPKTCFVNGRMENYWVDWF